MPTLNENSTLNPTFGNDTPDAVARAAAEKVRAHFGDPDIALSVEQQRRSSGPIRNFIARLFGRETDLQNQIGDLTAQLEAERKAAAAIISEHAALKAKVETSQRHRAKVEHSIRSYEKRKAALTDEVQRLVRKTIHPGYVVERSTELTSVERALEIANKALLAEQATEKSAIANLAKFEKSHADDLREVERV